MPVYEYQCKNCGERFEKIQPVMSDPLTECLLCGQGPIRRVLHPVGVIFKGSGWYVTDNRGSGRSGNSSGSKGDEDGKSSSSAEASTDKPKADASNNTSGSTSGGTSSTTSKSSDE
ncbi:MAG TPA: FmdB family zinc ribbon protein [Chloroflexia bacterium]|nr:FmdB family zinc ribbon protein [Chloroflexia bacterium]